MLKGSEVSEQSHVQNINYCRWNNNFLWLMWSWLKLGLRSTHIDSLPKYYYYNYCIFHKVHTLWMQRSNIRPPYIFPHHFLQHCNSLCWRLRGEIHRGSVAAAITFHVAFHVFHRFRSHISLVSQCCVRLNGGIMADPTFVEVLRLAVAVFVCLSS